ncbi:MAG: heme-binding protein [Candidatus Eremiobacteraeota bacterium]|nr:heme-binding protein [Candidatus Eremiobacteraeota bacterium]
MPPSLEAAAGRAIAAIVDAARAANFVVAIAVVDAHGDLVAAHRMDGARPRWMRASLRKAYSAAVMDRDTSAFHEEIVARQLQIAYYGDPMLTALPGGIVVAEGGATLAGIGVTGPTKGRDEELARAGARSFST